MRRREFLRQTGFGLAAFGSAAPWAMSLRAAAGQLPRRPIPGTSETLAIIGMGNSNAFREGDVQRSAELIGLFHEQGGSYIDCSGPSRFTVAEASRSLGVSNDLLLGTYFTGDDEAQLRAEMRRLCELTGKEQIDLAHSYPEYAVPNWQRFRAWKEAGLVRYIGVARHQQRYYESMIELMKTGTVDFVQVNYSPLETEAEQLLLPVALERGIAVTVNRPFLNGDYFARVRGHELPAWAAEFDCHSWAQFSLKYILSHPAVTCVLTETANPKHLADNIGGGFGRLPDAATRQRIVEYLRNL